MTTVAAQIGQWNPQSQGLYAFGVQNTYTYATIVVTKLGAITMPRRRRRKIYRRFNALSLSEKQYLHRKAYQRIDTGKLSAFLSSHKIVPTDVYMFSEYMRLNRFKRQPDAPDRDRPIFFLPTYTPQQRLERKRESCIVQVGLNGYVDKVFNLSPIDATANRIAKEIYSIHRLFSHNKFTKLRYLNRVFYPIAAKLMFIDGMISVYEIATLKDNNTKISFVARFVCVDRGVYCVKANTPWNALVAGRKLYGQIVRDILTGDGDDDAKGATQ